MNAPLAHCAECNLWLAPNQTCPHIKLSEGWARDYQVGDTVMWPDGSESRIASIDYNDDVIMDSRGKWHHAYDVEEAGQKRAYGAAALSALVVFAVCFMADRVIYGLSMVQP